MATVYYLELLTRMVDTMVDQGHPRILLQSISDSPDRTAYITGKSTQSPLPLLVETARSLQNAGADFLTIPCVTAHYFYEQLKGVTEPEKKRKIIGKGFIDIFDREARKLTDIKWLAQGTIYPDVIESLSITGMTIKSHHNVGGLPEKMNLKLVEPLRLLFKDEVRRVGRELGISEKLIGRHPFPDWLSVYLEISHPRRYISCRRQIIFSYKDLSTTTCIIKCGRRESFCCRYSR
mgnify:CR=1 FL=1